jgi:hypothetical protein
MDSHFNDDTTHWCTNLSRIRRIRLRTGDVLGGYCQLLQKICVPACLSSTAIDRTSPFISKNTSRCPVFSETGPTASNFTIKTYNQCHQPSKYLPLLQLHTELLPNLGLTQEIPRRQDTQIAILLHHLSILLIHLRILGITRHISLLRGAEFLFNVQMDFLEIKRRETFPGTLSQFRATTPEDLCQESNRWGYLCAEGLRKAAVGLTHETLEEVQY